MFTRLLDPYVFTLKVKRKVRLSLHRIQCLGVLLDDVRGHIALRGNDRWTDSCTTDPGRHYAGAFRIPV